MPEGPRPAVLVGFAAMVVLIGLNFVAVRTSNQELAPTWGAALRFGAAAGLLLAVVAARGIPLPRGRALVGAVLYGLLFFAVFFGFIYWGLVAVPASVASVVNACVPLMTFVAAVAVGLERFRWRALAGSLVVIAGIAVLVGSDAAGGAPPLRLAAVVVACVGAALGIPQSWLEGTPFADYTVPGVLLFLLGLLCLATAVLEVRRHRFAWAWTAASGGGLVVWIVVQAAMMGSFRHPAQTLLQALVLAVGVAATVIAWRQYRQWRGVDFRKV